MAILKVLTFPDPILRKMSKPVESVTAEMSKFADDMLETMHASFGIGLAAPQVGRNIRLLVMDTRPKGKDDDRYDLSEMTELEQLAAQKPIVIFNPKIEKKEGKQTFNEGCLSLPSYFEEVQRFDYIEVSGLNQKNEEIYLKLDGLMSVCMQHEIDHLDGKLFFDRLSPIKSKMMKSKILKFGYPSPEDQDKDNGNESDIPSNSDSKESAES